MLILGIETSCDETSVAIVEDGQKVHANIILSQIDLHKKYGGVVPEIASRAHIKTFIPVLEEALNTAGKSIEDIDMIAVTCGPGLVGALLMGVTAAKSIALSHNIPLMAVNHLHGHIYATFIENPEIEFPALAFVVSGGHTSLVEMPSHMQFKEIGSTMDDAAGESFDKVGKKLGLPYPAGPHIDRLSKSGRPDAVDFPRAMMKQDNYDFSFSGLKTAVIRFLETHPAGSNGITLQDITASFQQAVIDVLVHKAIRAAHNMQARSILLCGGVAANSALRTQLEEAAAKEGLKLYKPSLKLCTDNGAMIATAGYFMHQTGMPLASLDLNAYATLDIET
jgi:N6-L-threonylcarbamoyladenine synthase